VLLASRAHSREKAGSVQAGKNTLGDSEQVYGVSGFQASPGSMHHFEDVLVARQKMITQGLGSPESPKGRVLKHILI